MSRARAADDFSTIRARLDELRREREGRADAPDKAEENAAERRHRERMEGYPPPWIPTIFSSYRVTKR